MMNVYELAFGNIKHFVAAENEDEAYKLGTDPERFPDLHFRPFETRKVEVEGYTITVTPNEAQEAAETVTAPRRGRGKATA